MNGQTNVNPFAAWQDMMSEWQKALATGAASTPNPMTAWQDAIKSWSGAVSGAGPTGETAAPWQQWTQAMSGASETNPFTAWQEAMKSWSATQAGSSPAEAFNLWLSTFQKWVEQSSKFLAMGQPSAGVRFSNPFQNFNPFQSFAPAQMWQQLLQEYMKSWSEFASKNTGKPPSSDLFRDAERNWLGRLDSMGQELAGAMSTEEFSRNLGTSVEQSLVAEQRFLKATEDHANSFLRMFHIPSRGQIDRLFQRVIAIEERLDDAEDDTRALLKQLRQVVERLEALAERTPAPV